MRSRALSLLKVVLCLARDMALFRAAAVLVAALAALAYVFVDAGAPAHRIAPALFKEGDTMMAVRRRS